MFTTKSDATSNPPARAAVPAFVFALLVISAMFYVGCSSSTTPSSPPVRTCEEKNEPPTDDLIRCRLLQMSDSGRFPRRLAEDEAITLVAQLRHLSDTIRSSTDKDLIAVERTQTDNVCKHLTGLTCEALLSVPRSP